MHTYTSINNTHNKYIQHWRSSSVIFARCRSCLTLAQVVIHLMPPVTPIDHVNKVARTGCLVASPLSLSFPEVDLSRWREEGSLRVVGDNSCPPRGSRHSHTPGYNSRLHQGSRRRHTPGDPTHDTMDMELSEIGPPCTKRTTL